MATTEEKSKTEPAAKPLLLSRIYSICGKHYGPGHTLVPTTPSGYDPATKEPGPSIYECLSQREKELRNTPPPGGGDYIDLQGGVMTVPDPIHNRINIPDPE